MNRRRRPRIPILFLTLVIGCIPGCLSTQNPVPAPPDQLFKTIGQAEFELAVQEYRKENYSQSIRSFMNLIQRYPGAPILAEAQWMLAKSYEARRDYGQALEEYQRFIKNYPESEHLYEARLRTDVLERTVKPPALPDSHGTIRAVQFPLTAFVNLETFESTIQQLSKSGINTLIIPASQSNDPLPGIFFKSDQAPVIQDLLGPALALAHDYRMRVFTSIPLREMPWLKDAEWLDLKYDPVSRSFKSTQRLNLWNPAVQNYISALYLDLAAYPVDGLIIEEPVGYSEVEGFNETALGQFKNDFGISLAPSDAENRLTPAFWRWTGWKNRQAMAVLAHLVYELHAKQPKLRIGLAMSEEAIVFPKEALVNYGQDLLEANQAGFDFFIFSWPLDLFRYGGPAGILKRLKDFVPDRDKVILRVELDNPAAAHDFTEIRDLSLAFRAPGDSFEWIQGLPFLLFSSRPSP